MRRKFVKAANKVKQSWKGTQHEQSKVPLTQHCASEGTTYSLATSPSNTPTHAKASFEKPIQILDPVLCKSKEIVPPRDSLSKQQVPTGSGSQELSGRPTPVQAEQISSELSLWEKAADKLDPADRGKLDSIKTRFNRSDKPLQEGREVGSTSDGRASGFQTGDVSITAVLEKAEQLREKKSSYKIVSSIKPVKY